jgi:putative ABC transport system permease protein
MDGVLADIRYAARRLMAAPGFTSVAALTLALGIGATTAIYSVVDALMLRPLPYRDSERLVEISLVNPAGIGLRHLTPAQVDAWRTRTDLFEAMEPFSHHSAALIGDGDPQPTIGAAIGGGLMPMLGARAIAGRTIRPDDGAPGAGRVVVISQDLWARRFGADASTIGRTIRLDNVSYEIVGVMPAWFRFPYGNRDYWVPLAMGPTGGLPAGRASLLAKVHADRSVEETQSRVDAILPALRQDGVVPDGSRVELAPPIARHVNRPIKRALYVLLGAVTLVLLISCANLANLLLVQGAGRGREVGVRVALGAPRRRIVRQLLTEALLIALTGGLLGMLMAQWAIDLVAAFTPRSMTFLTASEITLDRRVMLFGLTLSILTAVAFGLIPAIRTSGARPHDALTQGTRSATGASKQERVRRAFALAQIALSLMLLVGAGLLTRTFTRLLQVDPGFDPHNLVTFSLTLPRWKYPTREAQQLFFDDVGSRTRATPGVVSTTLTGGIPPGGGGISFDLQFEIEGRGVVLDDPNLELPFSEVDADYFSVMRIPLRLGRPFTAEDHPGSPRAVIIGESMAQRLWNGASPIGDRIRWSQDWPWYTVVGVAGDVYQFEPDRPRGMFSAYYANSQSRGIPVQQTLVVRTAGDPETLVPVIREHIRALDPEQPILEIKTVQQAYSEFFAAHRFNAILMATFALIGLTIAGVGLYGVVAYATAQRTREFGIRLALGAQARDVLHIVLASGATLIGVGLVLGVVGSLLLARALGSLLVDVPTTDPLTYFSVIALLGTVALAACAIPARRATRVDPVVALRCE